MEKKTAGVLTIEIKGIWFGEFEIARNLRGAVIKNGEGVAIDLETKQGFIIPENAGLN